MKAHSDKGAGRVVRARRWYRWLTSGPKVHPRSSAIVMGLSFVVALAVVGPVATATAAAFTARVATGGANLNVRETPSLSARVLRALGNGTSVGLNCWTTGPAVTGIWGNTETTWDQIDGGGYVADALVDTGSNNPVVPACQASTPTPTGRALLPAGVDMAKACAVQHPGTSAVVADWGNAYSWQCSRSGASYGIDVNAACENQFGVGATSGLRNASDAGSWFCQWSPARHWGQVQATPAGDGGQCTYGMSLKFHDATGVYPAFGGRGDALNWYRAAQATGWSTSIDAQARSAVVFQPGSYPSPTMPGGRLVVPSAGHVAWVTAVERHSDGLYIRMTEMNGIAGAWNWDSQLVKDVQGMSYVLAP